MKRTWKRQEPPIRQGESLNRLLYFWQGRQVRSVLGTVNYVLFFNAPHRLL
jgi:hypothetical protein